VLEVSNVGKAITTQGAKLRERIVLAVDLLNVCKTQTSEFILLEVGEQGTHSLGTARPEEELCT
jgi:hypothetical protein